MRVLSWNDLDADAATYFPVALGRVTQGVVETAQNNAADSTDAVGWLQQNTPTSLLGLGFVQHNAGTIRATMLDAPVYLTLFQGDPPLYLPAGTDVCAYYSGDVLQYVRAFIPTPAMQVRAVPPFCARIHNNAPLIPQGINPRQAFSVDGQINLLMATRALAVTAGSNSHVADIDKRLRRLVALQIGPDRRQAC